MDEPGRTYVARALPWWLPCAFGAVVGVFGVVLVMRPFASLSVLVWMVAAGLVLTGIATMGLAGPHGRSSWLTPLGAAWILAGVLVAAWPGVTTSAVAVIVGVSLLLGGAVEVAAGLVGAAAHRVAAVIAGVASVLFGVLALTWPDVTLLVVAVVFGSRLMIFGVRVAWAAFTHRPGASPRRAVEPTVSERGWKVLVVPVATLVLAAGLSAVSVAVNRTEDFLDDFYDAREDVPSEPGVLVDSEPFDRAMPDGTDAWRILYTTTRADGVPALASGIVAVPSERGEGPSPVVAWAHGTTGVARHCAPSAMPDPWGSGAFDMLDDAIGEGWAVVATDYVGLGTEGGHPYLVGEPAGRSVLDAVRAARQLEDAHLAEETVVWGHSQGGGAALWTGIVAPDYAPEIDLVGVAALAPASDLVGLLDNVTTITGGSIFAGYALWGYAVQYDDVSVDDYVRPVARTTFDSAVERCLDARALASVLSSVVVGMDIFIPDFTSGPLMERVSQNVPTEAIPAPLLIAQGEADELVLPRVQEAYVKSLCDSGQRVDYRTYPGRGHVPLVQEGSPLVPQLIEWTKDRLGGETALNTC